MLNNETATEGRCIDGPHNYIFLCRDKSEETYNDIVTYDVFYCSKCLKQSRVKVEKIQGYVRS